MRHPAAFINAIAEGRNFAEALKYLQETWDELCEVKQVLERLQRASQEIRLDFAELPTEQQVKWIHLPEFREAIDASKL